jgi:hypothetical protein
MIENSLETNIGASRIAHDVTKLAAILGLRLEGGKRCFWPPASRVLGQLRAQCVPEFCTRAGFPARFPHMSPAGIDGFKLQRKLGCAKARETVALRT